MFKRLGKILGVTLLLVILLVVISLILIRQEGVQNRLAKEATAWLSNKLDTKVSIDKVKIDILNRVHFEGLYIEDQQQDTLAYIHDFSANSTSIISDLWNKKTSIIKNVKLEGGVVNILRPKDKGVWNFAFIEEAFATEDEKDSTKSEPPKIDFKNLNVSNVRFSMLDKWGGQDIQAKVGSLDLKMNGADIDNLNFNISAIDIENTDFAFKEYKGGKPKSKKIVNPDHSDWGSAFNPDNIRIALKKIDLKNVNFEYQRNGHESTENRFDERHIVANNINLDLEDLSIKGDTISADIVSLSAHERCGLDIKKLTAHVTLNQQLAELNDLYLETNRSLVQNYYSMRYTNFHDFNEYLTNVSMYVRLRNSRIDKRDIAFFAGDISQLPLVTNVIDGNAEGTVDNIFISKMHATAPNLNFIGSGRITGLPDVNNTFFELQADRLVTTGNEILRIAPEAKTDAIKWNQLSKVDFKGNFKGSTKKFNADGLLVTNQGNADFDIFMNLGLSNPSYKGRVDARNLNLGNVLGRKDLGIVSAKGNIEGAGFDFDNLAASVNAEIREFNFDGTRYQNIFVNGDVLDKKFNGIAKSRDANLGFDFEGKVDLSGKNPSYDFKSDIIRVNLKTLGLTKEDLFVKAKVNLDFKGKNIDEFVGKAILQDVNMLYNNQEIVIPRMRLNSYYTDTTGKVLDLKSSIADARVEGQYSLTGIDKSIRSFLHYYIPTYIKNETLPENEIFKFNLLVKDANKIINIFEPKLKVDSGTIFSGDINTPNQNLNLVGLLPNVSYNGIKLSGVGLKSKGTSSLFTSEIIAGKLFVGNSEIIKDAKLGINMSSDTMHFNLKTNPVDEFLGQAELDGKATAFNDRVQFDIHPSTFIVKDDKYRLFSYNPVVFTNDGKLLAKDVLIQNGNQQLTFNATHDGVSNNALLETENIDLEKVSKYLNSKDLVLNGRMNAKINVLDIWDKTQINGSLNSVDDIRLNTDTLGQAEILFDFDKQNNLLTIKEGSKIENQSAHLYTDGTIDLNKEELNVKAKLKETPISFANQYMLDIVDSLRGNATGDISIKGSFNNPSILGDLTVRNAGLKIIFTGCSYSMDDINLKLNKNSIAFNPIRIFDNRQPNPGSALLTGSISHSNYDKYRLRLNASSNDLLALNTNELNGDLFYGYIPAKVDMDITGAIDDITIDIKAEPLEKSNFYLPLADGGDVGSYDFIKFRSLGIYQNEKPKKVRSNYVKVNMDIKATPNVLATIILDQNTQEKIEARGNGNISLEVDLGNEIRMRNTFTVTEGIYKFNFRGLLSKDFDLVEGGTITWSGDAYKAQLDMEAVYKTKASVYALVSDDIKQRLQSDPNNEDLKKELRNAQNLEDTYVAIDLTGPLSTPKIVFDITQPNNRTIGGEAQAKLTQIRQNQNEVIYQAGMLLLFNSFKPSTGGVDAGNLGRNTTLSTASDMVSAVFSNGINSGINKLGIPNLSVNVDYKNYSTDASSGNRRDQFNLNLQASFFKDRFLVSFGNSLDFNDASSQSNGSDRFTYGGDFRGQYLLTLDGRYRLNAFRVSNFDYVQNEPVTRGGVGLSYKRSFNKWSDLFNGRSKRNRNRPRPKNSESQTGSIKKEESTITTTLNDILDIVSF